MAWRFALDGVDLGALGDILLLSMAWHFMGIERG
jgi:hypothetical protein